MTKRNRPSVSLKGESGPCALCRRVKKLVMDHCHAEGELREKLCGTCNSGLGMFRDDPELLRRAADYIERWRETFKDDELLSFARSKTCEQYRALFPRQ